MWPLSWFTPAVRLMLSVVFLIHVCLHARPPARFLLDMCSLYDQNVQLHAHTSHRLSGPFSIHAVLVSEAWRQGFICFGKLKTGSGPFISFPLVTGPILCVYYFEQLELLIN